MATGRTAGRALSMFKGGVALLNAEVKHSDVALSGAVSSTGVVTLLSGIAQGDGTSSRDGNSVKLKGGDLRYYFTQNGSASRTAIRVLVVVDTRNQGANPSISDILTSATVVAPPNLTAEPGRYVILSDEVFWLFSGERTAASRHIALQALMDMHLLFSGTSADVSSVSGPSVFLVTLSSETTNTPSISGNSRLLYLDN